MTELVNGIWIGNSVDERTADMASVLNVAVDLQPTRGWNSGTLYMHVGLVDGPGNNQATFAAAVLALASLLERGPVLVCCYDGSRSLAVSLMYLMAVGKRGWVDWLGILRERVDNVLPDVNSALKAAAGPWLSELARVL
jgi:hypothetical protein